MSQVRLRVATLVAATCAATLVPAAVDTTAPAASAATSPGVSGDIFFTAPVEVFGRPEEHIWRMHADGSDAHPLETTNSDLQYVPAVSPDSRYVVYVSLNSYRPGLYRIAVDGSGRRELTYNPSLDTDTFPSWSPDARHIVFVRDDGATSRLFTMEADGTHEHRIGRLDGSRPTYTPDGRRILFNGRSDDGGKGIFSVRPDGTGLRRLTRSGVDSSPEMSPDGRLILFVRRVRDNYEIFRMRADGSHQHQLTSGTDTYDSPTWSPDGRHFAFHRDQRGSDPTSIWIWDSTGRGRPYPLAANGGAAQSPSWSVRPSTCLGRAVTLGGTAGHDSLRGTPGPDVISGRGGDDTISGLGGNDVICGGTGNDQVYGGAGDDRLSGGPGRDHVVGGAGRDRIGS